MMFEKQVTDGVQLLLTKSYYLRKQKCWLYLFLLQVSIIFYERQVEKACVCVLCSSWTMIFK